MFASKVSKKINTLGGAQQREQHDLKKNSITGTISTTRKEPVCKISEQKEGMNLEIRRYGRNS